MEDMMAGTDVEFFSKMDKEQSKKMPPKRPLTEGSTRTVQKRIAAEPSLRPNAPPPAPISLLSDKEDPDMEGEQSKKSFCEWFDPYSAAHIKAYRHLQNHGSWPEGFVPEHIFIEPGWQTILAFKLANEWVRLVSRDN